MEEEVLGKAYDGRLMRRLLTYIRPYKSEPFHRPGVCCCSTPLLQVIGPLLTDLAIDRYLAPSGKATHTVLDPYLSQQSLDRSRAGFVPVSRSPSSFGMLCDFGEQYLMQWVGQKAMFDLRREIDGSSADDSISPTTTTIRSAGW